MQSHTTRRFEMGLPLFAGLDLGLILEAQAKISKGEFQGLSALVETLGKAGHLKTVRKLAAIWTASDIELKIAEGNPAILAELEEKKAELPFRETFEAAMAFQSALWESLGVSPVSSAAPEQLVEPKKKKGKTSGGSPSEG